MSYQISQVFQEDISSWYKRVKRLMKNPFASGPFQKHPITLL